MSVLGLDIGTRKIKVVEAKGGSNHTLSRAFVLNTPNNAVKDGELKDIGVIANAIKGLIKEKNINAKELYVSLKSFNLANRDIRLPALKADEISPAVEFDLNQTFPGILLTHTTSYVQYSKPGEQVAGLAVFCPTRILDGYAELSELIGIPLFRIDSSFNASVRALYQFNIIKNAKDTVMLCDIGEENSQITIVSGGRVLISRHIGKGAANADQVISDRLGLPVEEASEIRWNGDFKKLDADAGEIATLTRNGYSEIFEQIRQTLDFYTYNREQEEPISRLYLIGGGAYDGLGMQMQELFSLPVEYLKEDIKGIQGMKAGIFLSAAGAVTHDASLNADINLLPDFRHMKLAKAKTNQKAAVFYIAAGVAVLAAASFGLLTFFNTALNSEHEMLLKESKSYSEVNQVKQDIVNAKKRIESSDKIIKLAETKGLINTKLLDDLSSVMPEGLFLNTYSADGSDTLEVTGVSKTRHDIAEFINRAKENKGISDVTVGNITARLRPDGSTADYNFTVSITMKRQGDL